MARPIGRPRTFDPQATLRRIYATFREGGFSGTSLDQIAADTGLNRPSLYAAFGDKRAMYLQALALVATDLEGAADRLEAADLPFPRMLARWFQGCVEAYTDNEQAPGGCLAVCTASAEAVTDADIRRGLSEVLRIIDERMKRWFLAAGYKDAAARAALAAGLMHSLSLRARAGASASQLHALWRNALPAILGHKA